VSLVTALISLGTVFFAGAGHGSDLEDRVKYNHMRAHWSIEEGRRKIEASRAAMQQSRDERMRASKNRSEPASATTSGFSSSSKSSSASANDYMQSAGNGMNWYTNKTHKFRGLFLGQPQIGTKSGPLGTTVNTFTCTRSDGAAIIAVTELPSMPGDEASINKSLNGACTSSIAASHGVETARYSCSLQGHPGREFSANIPEKNGKMKSRLFLANNRLYQALVVGEPKFVSSSFAEQFIKGFCFL
jgi:hypothetical protein